jgi:hypothetical protein
LKAISSVAEDEEAMTPLISCKPVVALVMQRTMLYLPFC